MVGLSRLLLVFVVCMDGLRGGEGFSLTTASLRDGTTPKPTTMYRRINVETNFNETTVAVLELLRLKEKYRRRSRSNVWNWDYWCQLQPKVGNCTKSEIKHYYNAELDQCRSFKYSGCNGNKNRFESLKECERYCKGASYMEIQGTHSICSLQPNGGLCMALMFKYYFDVNDNICKTFLYGGCGGNHNRFSTMTDCATMCRQADDTVIL